MSMLPIDAHRRLEVPRTPLEAGWRNAQFQLLQPMTIQAGDRVDTTWHADGSVTVRWSRPAPPIDYDALVRVAYDRHRYAQGTSCCIAFARGAEWMRELIVKAQAEGAR